MLVRRPGITLRSAPGQRATLLGRIVIARTAHHVTVRGMRLDSSAAPRDPTPGGVPGARAPSPTVNAPFARFLENDVTGSGTGYCFTLGHPDYGRADDITIARSRIHDCGIAGSGHGHGIYASYATRATVTRNLIYDNEARGIQLYPDADRARITYNTLDANGVNLLFAGDRKDVSEGGVASHNVITGARMRWNVESRYPLFAAPGTGNRVERNCLFAGRRGNLQSTTVLGYAAYVWWLLLALALVAAIAIGIRFGVLRGVLAGAVAIAAVPGVVLVAHLRHDTPVRGYTAVANVVADPGYADRRRHDFRLRAGSPCASVGRYAPAARSGKAAATSAGGSRYHMRRSSTRCLIPISCSLSGWSAAATRRSPLSIASSRSSRSIRARARARTDGGTSSSSATVRYTSRDERDIRRASEVRLLRPRR